MAGVAREWLEDIRRSLVGDTRTTVIHLKDLNLMLGVRKIPLEGTREGLRGDQMCIFKFVTDFEPCRDRLTGKTSWGLLKLEMLVANTLSLSLAPP